MPSPPPNSFRDIHLPDPSFDQVATEYEAIEARWDRARSPTARMETLQIWDRLRRRLETWEALVHLQFNQDTRDEAVRTRRERLDALRPQLARLAVSFKQRLIDTPHRAELEAALGKQAFALWEADVAAFDPALERPMEEEAGLEAEYISLLASARIPFDGRPHTLAELRRPATCPDRDRRHEAERARWGWFEQQRGELDRIFGHLIALRTDMAHVVGAPTYIELAYRIRQRVGYGPTEVAAFRRAIRDNVVSFAAQLRRRQAARLGVRRTLYWDEAVHDPSGNPEPQGDPDTLLQAGEGLFAALHPALSEFFVEMRQRDLLDLTTRPGKADGGFCTGFPLWGLPFVFASLNGTKADVEVFTHELGHAFQFYRSSGVALLDYAWPTTEACEVHSMGLEFLAWPQMHRFFADRAERFRRNHLTDSVVFLPYAAAVDEFQHLVYGHPEASADERRKMWQGVERAYLPWRVYRDLVHPAAGGFWQAQRHLYIHPFYYIDYALALTCALQLWARSRQNHARAMQDYISLCDRGGSLPFQPLMQTAGLQSPLAPGCVSSVIGDAKRELENLSSQCSRDSCTI